MTSDTDLVELRRDAEASVLRRIIDARGDIAMARLVELAQAVALLRTTPQPPPGWEW